MLTVGRFNTETSQTQLLALCANGERRVGPTDSQQVGQQWIDQQLQSMESKGVTFLALINQTPFEVTVSVAINHFKNLTSLDLSKINLILFPDVVCDLVSLTELDVSDNQLQFLAERIGNLSNLESLDVSNNDLLALPNSLLKCEKLINFKQKGNRQHWCGWIWNRCLIALFRLEGRLIFLFMANQM